MSAVCTCVCVCVCVCECHGCGAPRGQAGGAVVRGECCLYMCVSVFVCVYVCMCLSLYQVRSSQPPYPKTQVSYSQRIPAFTLSVSSAVSP